MADDKSKTSKPDRDRINTSEPYEIRGAAEKYGVTPQRLFDAVASVGPLRTDVERYLKKEAVMMAEDMNDAGKPEGDLVNLNDDCLQGWSNRLGVTVHELQVAVEKVGPKVDDVRRFLWK